MTPRNARARTTPCAGLLAALDWTRMKPILSSVARRIREDHPYTFLYETQRIAVAGPRLHGVSIDIPSDPLSRLERYWMGP